MSFLKSLLDNLPRLFPTSATSSSTATLSTMDAPASSLLAGRTLAKLKGYFDLAAEEIDKAVRAEERGLPDDALSRYRTALRILAEAKACRIPSPLSSREQGKVNDYLQKIYKWHDTVSERLKVLNARIEGKPSPPKISLVETQARTTSSISGAHKVAEVKPSWKRTTSSTGNQKNNLASSKNVPKDNNYDHALVEMINTTIIDRSPAVKWEDVAGLDKAKQSLLEMVILPTKRRDLFTGLRKPARGLLLFGPPGNGKTMLAKAVASESEATFFNISSSSLTSKWVGEAEKLVRTLFTVAVSRQPSIIFMDEVDSLLSARSANENDASRRLKSEFLVQFDGVASNPNDLVIVVGATNKPQELDDAVLRRLVKRIYVPLPEENVRRCLLKHQLKDQAFSLPGKHLEWLVCETEGYSGSDLQALCQEAAMIPIRELGSRILTTPADQVRPLIYEDFRQAMSTIRPSLNKSKLEELELWNKEFGSN